jgi:predicted methyltransferase
MDLTALAKKIDDTTPYPFSERDARRLLSALLASEDIWRVIDLSDVPVMALAHALQEMAEAGWVEFTRERVRLTEQGRAVAEANAIQPALELRCPRCGGRGIDLGPVAKIADIFKDIAGNRPEAIQKYDQGYVTEESTLYRVSFMWSRGDLAGREILILGDDDLVSIAAALTGAPKRVVVVDIDERLVEFIREVASEEGLELTPLVHDLREPLPKELTASFDTFFCDPTESLRGFLVFAGRGVTALKGVGSAGYMGLTHREASLVKWRAIQEELLGWGAVFTEIRDDFHDYVNWPYIETMRSWDFLPVRRVPGKYETWYRSALLRIELVEKPSLPNERVEGDIFTDPEAATT